MPVVEYGGQGGGGAGVKAVTIDGNTSGTKTLISSGTLTLAGFGNVTLSQVGNAISISGGGGTAAGSFSAGVSSDGNTLGTTGTVSNLLKLVGGSNITLSESSNAGGATVTWLGNAPFSGGVSNVGNTLGTTGTVSKQVLFVGGNNITLSQSSGAGGATITFSGPNTVGAQTGISGISASDTLYTSGTVRLSGSNNVTVRSSAAGQTIVIDASFSQSTQTYNVISAGGNTAGALSTQSTGTIFLAGGNNITLSQNSNSITISGANVGGAQTGISSIAASNTTYTSGQVEFTGSNAVTVRSSANQRVVIDASFSQSAQTGISGISASDTVYTSGTVKFTGSNLVTVKSGTGQAVIIDVSTTQSVQTQNVVDITAAGNTSGTLALVSSGTLTLAGGNNITLSQAGNAITISGAEGGGAGISTMGNTAGTTGIAGSQLILVGGTNITLSQSLDAGSSNATLTIIGASGGAFSGGVSGGNTSGDTGSVTGRLLLAGGSNITLSGSTNAGSMTVTIIGASGGGTGGVAVAASNTTYTSGTVVFTGSNNITVASGTGQQVIISGPTGGGAGMGSAGNSAGTSGSVGKELYIVGSNNITLSQSVNGVSATLSVIGAAAGTGGGISGISASNTVYTSGTVAFTGSNAVTVRSTTGQAVVIDVTIPSQTGISGISASNTLYTSGTVLFTGSNIITVKSSGAGQTVILDATVPAQTVQTYNVLSASGNTSGTLSSQSTGTIVLAGGSNITLSQSSNTITIIGASGGTGGGGIAAGMGATGNTSGNTFSSSTGTIYVQGTNNITVSGSTAAGSLNTIWISGPTGGGAGMGASGNSSGTAGSVGKELYLVGSNNITLSQSVNAGSATLSIIGAAAGTGGGISGISGSNTVYTSGTVALTGSNIVTVRSTTGQAFVIDASTSQSNQQVTLYAGSNTFGTSSATINASSFVVAGSGEISVAASNGSIIISAPVDTGTGATNQLGMSNLGNTSGTSGVIANAVWKYFLAGGNNITLSQSLDAGSLSGTLTISAANQTVQTQNLVSINGSTGALSFNAGANLSLSTNGSSLTFINVLSSSASAADVGTQSNAGAAASRYALVDHVHRGVGGVAAQGTASTFVGSVVISAGNNITLSTGGNTTAGSIAIHGVAAQTVQTQNSVQIDGSSGAITFVAGNNISVSNNASTISIIDVLSSSNSAADVGTATNAGAQSSRYALVDHVHRGVAGIVASGTASTFYGSVVISAGNNVTLSTAGGSTNGSIAIHAAAGGAAGTQTIGMSNLGNTSGTTGVATGTGVQFAIVGSNNITLSQSINGASGTISIIGGAGGAFSAGVSTGGNTSGDTKTVGSQVVFVGSNNITLSQGTNGASATITISGPTGGGAGMGTGANTSGTSGTVGKELYVYGGANISLSQSVNGSSASLSIIGASGGTGGAGNVVSASGNTSGTLTSFSTGTLVLAGGNNVTLSQSSNSITISAATQSVQTQGMVSVNGSTGAISISGASNITASNNASTITVYGPANILNSFSVSGNTGTTGSSNVTGGGFVLAGGANITLNQSNNTISIVGGAGGGGAAVGVTNTGNTAGNLFTASSGTVYVQASNNVTASASTAAGGVSTIWISGPTGGGAGMGTGTNTSGTSGTVGKELYFYGNSNIGLSQSVNGSSASLTIVGSGGGGGGIAAGVTNTGNTSGNLFSSSTGTIFIAGTNNITISASTAAGSVNTIWVSGPGGDALGVTNTGNTAGNLFSASAGSVWVQGTNNITISASTAANSSTIWVSGPSLANATISQWMPPGVGYSSFTQQGQSSLVLFPAQPPQYVTATEANVYASISLSTSSNSSHNGYISLDIGIYTKNASTLSLASSGSTVHTWNVTGTTSSGSVFGWRMLSIPINVNMSPGDYWIGLISRTATTNANWFTASNMALIPVAAAFSGPLGATNNTNQFMLGMGVWSAQTAAMPASVAFSHITATSASTGRPIVVFNAVTV